MKAVNGIEELAEIQKLDVKNTNTECFGFSNKYKALNSIKLAKTTKSVTGIHDLSEVNIDIIKNQIKFSEKKSSNQHNFFTKKN